MTTTMAQPPAESPWGPVLRTAPVAPGIYWVQAKRCDGLWLRGDMRMAMPCSIRRAWFEWEFEWSVAALAFPGIFDPAALASAKAIAREWYPAEFSILTGEVVEPSDPTILMMVREVTRRRYPEAFRKWQGMIDRAGDVR